MATTIGDAKVRVTIDRSQAKREIEEVEKEQDRREDDRERAADRRERDQQRRERLPADVTTDPREGAGGGASAGASRARQAIRRSVSDLRAGRPITAALSTIASIPGVELAGVAIGAALVAEELGPLAQGFIPNLLPEGPARGVAEDALGALDEKVVGQIRALRSLLSAAQQTQDQLRGVLTARILTSADPAEFSLEGTGDLARAFFDANAANARIERDRKALTRKAVGAVIGSEMRETFSGAMGGQ